MNADNASQPDVKVTSGGNQDGDSLIVQAMAEYRKLLDAGGRPDRAGFLARYPSLVDELETCLDSLEFIHTVAPQFAEHDEVSSNAAQIQPFASLGDYRIVRELGRGGMGVVYEADQLSMGRKVALKILPFAALLDERQLQRFKNEARAAGALHHPHIVPVFGVGTERGVHYYAMQHIDGPSLAEVLHDLNASESSPNEIKLETPSWKEATIDVHSDNEQAKLDRVSSINSSSGGETRVELQGALSTKRSSAARVDYFRSVAQWGAQAADGLAYAHENGVLHRDIKPGNLLLDNSGKLWVTDFGLARLESDASMTMTGDIIGTLRYMAPEQALAKRVLIDHRADIYSLGVTLYELATLQPAFSGNDREEVLHQVAFQDPIAPTKIDASIPKDLEIIILKAAAKAPEERYASAQELADDLQCFLQHKPIAAKPPTFLDRTRKWTRRHRAVTWSAATVLLVLSLASILGFAWARQKNVELAQAVSRAESQTQSTSKALARESNALAAATAANTETQQALEATQLAEHLAAKHLYMATMRQAYADLRQGQSARFAESMTKFIPAPVQRDLRQWEWHYLLGLYHQEEKVLREHVGGVMNVAWHPAGKYLATGSVDGTVRLWDPLSWKVMTTIGQSHSVYAIAWHPEGELLAVATTDRKIRIWNIRSGLVAHSIDVSGECRSIDFDADGHRLAAALSDAGWKVWDSNTATEVWSKQIAGARAVAWAPDGKRLVCGTNSGENVVQVFDIDAGEMVSDVAGIVHGVFDIAWSPMGERVAVCEGHKAIKVFDAEDFQLLHSIEVPSVMEKVNWSPSGKFIAAGIGRNVHIYDRDLQLTKTLAGHSGIALSVDWRPTGNTLAAGSADGATRIWDLDHPSDPIGVRTAWSDLLPVAETGETFFSSTARFLAAWNVASQQLEVRDLSDGTVLHRFDVEQTDNDATIAWSGNDRLLAHPTDGNQAIAICDIANGKSWPLTTLSEGVIAELDWSPHRPRLAAVVSMEAEQKASTPVEDVRTHIKILNTETGELERSITIRATTVHIAWSPTGDRLASIEYSGASAVARIWDASTGELLHTLSGHDRNTRKPQWSPDGHRLAAFSWTGHISIWDTDCGVLDQQLYGHEHRSGGAWHPGSQRIVSHSDDGTLRLWDVESGEEILRLDAQYQTAVFSLDGRKLYLRGDALDVIDLDASKTAGTRELVEYAGTVMINQRRFEQAEQLIEWLELGRPERRYLQRRLFSGYATSGRDIAADGSLIHRLHKLISLWRILVANVEGAEASVIGVSEAEDLSRTLLYWANMAPIWAAHYEQDVRPFLPVMEEIVDEVESYFAQSSVSPDTKAIMTRVFDDTKDHINELKSTNSSSTGTQQGTTTP